MRSFGEILTSLREERGIYQKELAAILKVSVGTVSNYENNIHFPDQEALLQLADYFGVTVDYLLGRTSYRYSLDTLNEEYAPGMTVAGRHHTAFQSPEHGILFGLYRTPAITTKGRGLLLYLVDKNCCSRMAAWSSG